MRLNKYIAQAGIASRRKADELTAAGKVKLNGVVMTQLGYDVKPEDVVEVEGRTIGTKPKTVYYMLNKPVGYITTSKDEQDRPTVLDLMVDVEQRVFPVGRLDFNTSGLLIMTNDGALAYRLTHPKHNVFKTYRARVSGYLAPARLARLREGVDIGGYKTSPAKVNIIREGERSTIVEIQISEGKNRQVRKMFAAVGNKVVELERIAVGELRLGHLKEGSYRKLSQNEIEYLKNC